MRSGKVSDAVLKRSVLKLIDGKNDKVIAGAGIGQDCSVIEIGEEYILTSTQCALTGRRLEPYFAVIKAANNIAVCGGTPVSASAAFILSCDFNEQDLKKLTRSVLAGCKECKIQLSGGHTELTENASGNMAAVTVTGWCKKGGCRPLGGVKAGMELVICGSIGMEGTAYLYDEQRERLISRLPESYVDGAKEFYRECNVAEMARRAGQSGAAAMHDVSGGGIFAALWHFAEAAKVGLEVELKAIPVRQETVEFCEIFDINPYQMPSAGCILMAAEHGTVLAEALKDAGFAAAVIGHTTEGNDKIILNGDEVRYLDKP